MTLPGYTIHAAQRAAERFGINPTRTDWQAALLSIIAKVAGDKSDAVRLRVQSDQCEVWAVIVCGRAVSVVYDPDRANIITALLPKRPKALAPAQHARLRSGKPVERWSLEREERNG